MKVKGFKAAAVNAGLRYKDRFDLGLMVSEAPAAWAGVFTQSQCAAAPVLWSREVSGTGTGMGRAFLVNAGQANAQTGLEGAGDCRRSALGLSKLLAVKPEEIMLASTGIIGQRINMSFLEGKLPELVAGLREEALDDFSQAILTTDLTAKTSSMEFDCQGVPVSIWGCVKGSGMIAPNMATMLAFILTDASVGSEVLPEILVQGADLSFNRITIDGDTSTNDSLMMMASGASGAPVLETGSASLEQFKGNLFTVMKDLARQVVRDGEGATKLVTIRVRGAANEGEARQAARTVAESPLVKTAFYGEDANWGRICMALGRCGAKFAPYAVDIDLDEVPWIRAGLDNGQEAEATLVMKRAEYILDIDLKAGSGAYEMLTCDFSHEYVNINGSYRS